MRYRIDNPDPAYCVAAVWSEYGFRSVQCSRKASMGEWCRQHHPDSVRARRDARQRKYDAARAAMQLRDDQRRARNEQEMRDWMAMSIWLNATYIEWRREGSNASGHI